MTVPTRPCRTAECGLPVRWERTVAGRPMPLDPEPNPAGNVEITRDGAVVRPAGYDWPPTAVRWMPHFVTCKKGKEWSQGLFPL